MSTTSRTLARKLAGACACCALLLAVGCDRDWAKRLDTGRIVPNIRFDVALPEPVPKASLYDMFHRIAIDNGFTTYYGRPVVPQTRADSGGRAIFAWSATKPDSALYNLEFHWETEPGLPVSTFEVALLSPSLDDFNEEQWRLFGKWRDEILPSAFPSARVEVLRHPAEFTDAERAIELSRLTGIELPGV